MKLAHDWLADPSALVGSSGTVAALDWCRVCALELVQLWPLMRKVLLSVD